MSLPQENFYENWIFSLNLSVKILVFKIDVLITVFLSRMSII